MPAGVRKLMKRSTMPVDGFEMGLRPRHLDESPRAGHFGEPVRRRETGSRPIRLRHKKGWQEPALRSGRDAPSSCGRRGRRATRRTRRSVSIAPPKAGRGTSAPGRSSPYAELAPRSRQGSSPEWAETRANVLLNTVVQVTRGSRRDAARARPRRGRANSRRFVRILTRNLLSSGWGQPKKRASLVARRWRLSGPDHSADGLPRRLDMAHLADHGFAFNQRRRHQATRTCRSTRRRAA